MGRPNRHVGGSFHYAALKAHLTVHFRVTFSPNALLPHSLYPRGQTRSNTSKTKRTTGAYLRS